MNKTSAILQSLGFGYRLTELEFPNNAKPFSLAVMVGLPLVNHRQTTKMIPKHYITNTKKEIGFSIIIPDKYLERHLVYGNHRHSFYEVLLILKGSGIHQIDFTDYTIKESSISFLAPGQVHNLNKSSISNCVILIFNEDFIYKTLENATLLKQLNLIFNQSPILELNPNELNELIPTLLIIETELKKENFSKDILFHSLNLLLFQTLSFCKETNKIKPTALSKKRYFDFLELVENNYSKEHSVKYYAKQLNIHPKRLNEITQLTSGDNALKLIQKRILIEAKRLLFYSNLSIKEIAYQLGFEDVSYFSKFFQKNVGVRPSTFQESNPESTT